MMMRSVEICSKMTEKHFHFKTEIKIVFARDYINSFNLLFLQVNEINQNETEF